jgi:hypothetical protein
VREYGKACCLQLHGSCTLFVSSGLAAAEPVRVLVCPFLGIWSSNVNLLSIRIFFHISPSSIPDSSKQNHQFSFPTAGNHYIHSQSNNMGHIGVCYWFPARTTTKPPNTTPQSPVPSGSTLPPKGPPSSSQSYSSSLAFSTSGKTT